MSRSISTGVPPRPERATPRRRVPLQLGNISPDPGESVYCTC
jgi:hypothetical protein